MENEKMIMSCKDVAKYLGLNYFTIIKYAKSGKIPAFKTGKDWKFHRETLDNFLKEKSMLNVRQKQADVQEAG
jgi:excisionase family DNA binding protein